MRTTEVRMHQIGIYRMFRYLRALFAHQFIIFHNAIDGKNARRMKKKRNHVIYGFVRSQSLQRQS